MTEACSAIAVDLPEELADLGSAELFERGALGVEVRDRDVTQPMPGTPMPRVGRAVLVAYFSDSMAALQAATQMAEALGAEKPITWSLVDVPPTDWDRAWRAHFKPVKLGARLWIRPSWEPSPLARWARGAAGDRPSDRESGEVEVVLDPGTAFGTGAHATTALCLRAIEEELATRPGAAVLDVGCGSGILAIAALRLGAARAVATDNDPEALRVASENAARNGVTLEVRTDLPEARFPLVVANILAETLIELAPTLAPRVAPDGLLLLCGILAEQADAVATAYAPYGLARGADAREGEWVLLRLARPG